MVETKLARSTKARAIIQLCFYSDLLAEIQGVVLITCTWSLAAALFRKSFSCSATSLTFEKSREFESAYHRVTRPIPSRSNIAASVAGPVFVTSDGARMITSRWSLTSLAPAQGAGENQVSTLAALGGLTLPRESTLEGIGAQALFTIREQARLQLQVASGASPFTNCFRCSGAGALFPSLPSPGDIFLDFEGDAFALDQGLEYLFGVLTVPKGMLMRKRDRQECLSCITRRPGH